MSYNSKKTISSIIAGATMMAAYAIYALSERSPAPDDIKSWAIAMLIFIGISVVAVIAVHILFHIMLSIGIAVKERAQDEKLVERMIASAQVEDERDKLVAMRSARIGYGISGAGFVAALVALALGVQVVAALHIPFAAFAIGSLVEGIVSVYYYEIGIKQ